MEPTTNSRRAPRATLEAANCTCAEHRRLGREEIALCVVQAESQAAALAGQLDLYIRDRDLLPKLTRAYEKQAEVIHTEIPTANVPECVLAFFEQLAAEIRWRIERK